MLAVGYRQSGILGSPEDLVHTVAECREAVTGWGMILCTGLFFLMMFVPEDPLDIDS